MSNFQKSMKNLPKRKKMIVIEELSRGIILKLSEQELNKRGQQYVKAYVDTHGAFDFLAEVGILSHKLLNEKAEQLPLPGALGDAAKDSEKKEDEAAPPPEGDMPMDGDMMPPPPDDPTGDDIV